MALYTATNIYIANTKIPNYARLKLVQHLQAHHELELVCKTEVVERLSLDVLEKSKTYLGASISLEIAPKSGFKGYGNLQFTGIVTKVKSTKGFRKLKGDFITIYAKSGSIVTDNGPHYASYTNLTLSAILRQTFGAYNQLQLKTDVAVQRDTTIHYTVQHNESAFAFASRLAATHNEWFYYDGQKLVFGMPSTDEIPLSYSEGLVDFTVELSAVANSTTYLANDYLNHTQHKKESSHINLPTAGEHQFVNTKSKALFAQETQAYQSLPADGSVKERLDTQVENYAKARAMHQVVAKGTSDNPGVQLGKVVKVKGHGNYRIIKVTHSNTEGGQYQNTFEAVDASLLTYPYMDIHRYPKSRIEIGLVKANNDPNGLGRVKVQLPWQKASHQTTPWLRVMTPHAGADKGFHFIPELGEEVVVNFEDGNAERPFVQGALYHGQAKPTSWQTPNNAIKAIRSRSGHSITLNDTKDGEKIVISDKNSNIIALDTATSTITISALENLILQAKNMEIRTTETLKVATGKHKVEQITGDYKLTASNIFEAAVNDMKTQGETINRQAVADMSVSSTTGNINKQAQSKVNNNSGEQGNVF